MADVDIPPIEVAAAERQRLAAVQRMAILDTPPDGAFDRITAVAARTFGVPIALVSVVDEDRIWFKSHHGLDLDEVERSPGLCASAILADETYVLPDASVDPIALANPMVAEEFGLRFYAAAPLVTSEGFRLGTLCVADREPREVTPGELETLRDLARVVVDQLELRLEARQLVDAARLGRDAARVDQLRSAELVVALQSALLPVGLPMIAGLDVAARFRPADEADVGGDFYDIFALSRRSWAIAVGDVCGKGARAAAVSGAARYAVRAAAIEHDSPAKVLEVLNNTLMLDEQAADSRFCTIVYGRIRPHGTQAFHLTVASGGHPLPLVLRSDGRVDTLGAYGSAVGLFGDSSFTDQSTRLRRGDAVAFFTDGITEARARGDLFGSEGIAATLRESVGCSARDIASNIETAAQTSWATQRDDIAIIVIKVTDSPATGDP